MSMFLLQQTLSLYYRISILLSRLLISRIYNQWKISFFHIFLLGRVLIILRELRKIQIIRLRLLICCAFELLLLLLLSKTIL